jgi:hypothetical protein
MNDKVDIQIRNIELFYGRKTTDLNLIFTAEIHINGVYSAHVSQAKGEKDLSISVVDNEFTRIDMATLYLEHKHREQDLEYSLKSVVREAVDEEKYKRKLTSKSKVILKKVVQLKSGELLSFDDPAKARMKAEQLQPFYDLLRSKKEESPLILQSLPRNEAILIVSNCINGELSDKERRTLNRVILEKLSIDKKIISSALD